MSDPESLEAGSSPAPITFKDLPLDARLQAAVHELGYGEPTAIQQDAIPFAVHGRDLIGTAQTGTGKTAAFLLPILERLLDRPRGRIRALVLTPTRELALQAEGFLRDLGRHTGIRGKAVYGGASMGDQEAALRGGADVVIATPGRLLDHMRRGYVRWDSLEVLVLDEADRMLDMGFLPDVRRILQAMPKSRQTLLFSATMPPEVVRLSREFLHDPRMVRIPAETVAAVGVRHSAFTVPAAAKTALLRRLLEDRGMTKVLVFVRTKHRADRLFRDLARAGVQAGLIHGNRSQNQRNHALDGFRRGAHRVLVATDIAARGVDVEHISHVINYDVPNDPEVYVHRVGRTARAQRQGDAITFVAPDEDRLFRDIEKRLEERVTRLTTPILEADPVRHLPPARSFQASAPFNRPTPRRRPADNSRRNDRYHRGGTGRGPYRESRGQERRAYR